MKTHLLHVKLILISISKNVVHAHREIDIKFEFDWIHVKMSPHIKPILFGCIDENKKWIDWKLLENSCIFFYKRTFEFE